MRSLIIVGVDIDQFTCINKLSLFCCYDGDGMSFKYLLITSKRESIPKEVFNLCNLMGFNIYNSDISELPKQIINFRRVKLIFLENMCNIKTIDNFSDIINICVRNCYYLLQSDRHKIMEAEKLFIYC